MAFCRECGKPLASSGSCDQCGSGVSASHAGAVIPGSTAVRRKVSAGVFALIVLTFFLPWVQLSCADQPVGSVTGFELLTGQSGAQEIRQGMNAMSAWGSELFGALGMHVEQPRDVSSERAIMVMVLVAAIAGGVLVLVIPGARMAFGVASVLGAILVLLLASLASAISSAVASAGPFIQVKYEAGFYLAFGLALAATLMAGYALLGAGSPSVRAGASAAGRSPPAVLLCPRCGEQGNPQEPFCTACGTRIE